MLPDGPVGREHAFGDERSERAVGLIEIAERAAVHQDRQVGRGDLDLLDAAGGRDLAPDRDECRHLTDVGLEELAAVERGVRSGSPARSRIDGSVELRERLVQPRLRIVPVDDGTDGNRADGRDRPVLDRQGRPVPVEQRLQRSNGRLGALERLLHALQMRHDRLIADGDVGRVQDDADLLEWHVEVAEPADDLRDRNLAGRVTAVAAGTVDLRRAQEAHVVVMAKRLHAQMRHPGELTDGQQHAHVLSVHPPPTGESSADGQFSAARQVGADTRRNH